MSANSAVSPDDVGTCTSSVASTLATTVGIVGAAVLACVASGWMFGSSVLLSTTGSMAPAVPTAAVSAPHDPAYG